MNIRHLILSGLAVAAMGFAVVGCNENPIDTPPTGTGTAPAPPTGVQATSLSASSVGLKWTAPSDTGTITYRIAYKSEDGLDSGSASVSSGTSYTVNNLSAGKGYEFEVFSVRRGVSSTSHAEIDWAGALRYPNASTTIRMYESNSNLGSGLTLDPALGGPVNVKVGLSNPTPERVQLAIYTKGANLNQFAVGAANAFDEYVQGAANAFDQNTFISTSSYPALSLNDWYSTGSIDAQIPTNGNVRAFDLPNSQTGQMGQGFYVRTGTTANFHYARVFIKNNGGKLLQGTAPDRYVELEISYQQTANLAFAKGRATAPNYTSTTGH